MYYDKRKMAALVCGSLLVWSLFGCQRQNAARDETISATSTTSAPAAETLENGALDLTGATKIIFSGETASVSGSGAEFQEGTLEITKAGTYLLSGTLSDGQILVNAKGQEVTLVLNGVSVTCSDSSALYCHKAETVHLYLMEGTENSLSDGEAYDFSDVYSSEEDEEPNACLYSKADLTISGSGALTVTGNYKNGITGKDTLAITSSNITVEATNHGINGKDNLTVTDAALTVTSGGDAIRSTNDSDSSLGWIVLTNSDLNLTPGEDGIQAEKSLTVSGGTYRIVSGGGSGASLSDDASAKGLKAGTDLTVTSGAFTLDCADDTIHSNGNVTISGGEFTLSSGDDGIHADETAAISDGTIEILTCYEGVEGTVVDISGGKISLTATDDGLNAADGTQMAFDPMGGGNSSCRIEISGGEITIDAAGDGIDSNGDFLLSGGTVYVSGPTSDGDGALDYDGSAFVTGGVLIAAGSSGMAQNFGESGSAQGSILLTYNTSMTGTIRVLDSDGTVLAEYTPTKEYRSVVVTAPGMVSGGTYTVEAGSDSQKITLSGLIYGSSGMGGPGGQGGMGGPNGNGGFGGGGTPPDGAGDMGTPPDGAGDMGDPPDGGAGPTPPEGAPQGGPGTGT